ncbi:MAG: dihydroorotase [Desulfobulbaceae bacterium]|uniref:Dihydroorotase n=1 Tax=Candidatus Desulfatifera sulfidica TaxID=2841691 RepID=A0A8J6NBF5_9BACT|nr:dihydroorotase [Candidatus Desulfatifera sulfidica]
MSECIVFSGGRIIDPVNGIDHVGELAIADGCIVADSPADARRIDLTGKWLIPGLIDMHVHLREPGEEYKETIATGTRAAAAGGFTAVACMPNTRPVNDEAAVTRLILENAAAEGSARVYPVGAISRGSRGEELAEYGEMKAAGIRAVSDDGLPVVDSQLMRRALEYAAGHGLLVISHSEEHALSRGGSMNEGALSTRMGLRGIPTAAESIMIYRELALAELTGQRIHIAHVSAASAIDLIRQAKARGVRVTAETAPHYFTLTEAAVDGYNTHAKMSPPLRSEADRKAVCQALVDGTFDAIATDHAPHSVLEKEVEFDQAANGIIGLESALPLALALVRKGLITPTRLVELMSAAPARILGVEGGSLTPGGPADLAIIDPDLEFLFSAEDLYSKSKNSPFLDWSMQGRAILTICNGRITHDILGLFG